MTFSLTERLYSKMTGLPFSSSPSESMRPPCFLPVECSLATKRTPKSGSMLRSMRTWSGLSRASAVRCSSTATPLSMRKSLRSSIGRLAVVPLFICQWNSVELVSPTSPVGHEFVHELGEAPCTAPELDAGSVSCSLAGCVSCGKIAVRVCPSAVPDHDPGLRLAGPAGPQPGIQGRGDHGAPSRGHDAPAPGRPA